MQTRQDRSCHFVLVVFATWSAISGSVFAQASHPPPDVLVRQIDHILLNSEKPEQLFAFFTEKLGFPVVWPFQSYGTFSSGGVGFGNVNIELTHLKGSPSGLVGVALEPGSASEALVSSLDARGLKHGAPAPVYQKDSSGKERLSWTTVQVTSLPPALGVFFCKYDSAFFDLDEGRAMNRRELESHGGGPLGIQSTMELVIGVRDITTAQRDYRALLGPPRDDRELVWQVGAGPAVRLVADHEDHLALLRMKVKSLERARAFLRGEHLLGADTGHEIALERSRVADADIRFVE
jgi:catechol 2,3-dioxygenase-like lactoylglutathione lyase family enzyme